MVSITSLGYMGLGVSDVEAWRRFAPEVLGLQAEGPNPDGSVDLRMDVYHHRFRVHPGGNDDIAYVGWEVHDEATLEQLAKQLKAAGTNVTPGSQSDADERRVVGLIKFQDPNGIASEAFFGALMNFDKPFRSPRPISGFVTGEQGLGHFVLMISDFDKNLQFYKDALGMRVSDYVRMEMGPGVRSNLVFLHCNPRHHTLALIAAPNAPKLLNHFMLQLNSLDDVGLTYDLCKEQGVTIPGGLGRHTNDHMFSFYLRTPSGFDVEYGWGAREVDEAIWQVQMHPKGSIWGHEGIYPTLPKTKA